MDRPPPDPTKLLEAWMEWERGEAPPGKVMSTLKTGGLRDILEGLAAAETAARPVAVPSSGGEDVDTAAETWKPVV